MFADKVEIEARAGKGGNGKLSFRHEKYRAKGGPDGGDGGKGADAVLRADHNLNTLSYFKTKPRIQAPDGQSGGDNRKKGRSGADTVIDVPVGTIVYELPVGHKLAKDSDLQPVADLAVDGQTVVMAKGGRGGFGNAHFTASSRQAPQVAELGEPGQVKKLVLELKMVADVGLVGLPNAGKSTLLSVISNARPAIGDYPFTTLVPNLGVVDHDDHTMLVADIPGLIEGASAGKGLGDDFLRHIERTAVLVHLIDATSSDPAADYRTVNEEIKTYNIDIVRKPQLVVFTKIDAVPAKDLKLRLDRFYRDLKLPRAKKVFAISAIAHQGLDELLRALRQVVQADRTERGRQAEIVVPASPIVIDRLPVTDQATAEAPGVFRLSGPHIESFALRTDWDNPATVDRLRDIAHKTGLARELARLGARPGDKINIGDKQLEWS